MYFPQQQKLHFGTWRKPDPSEEFPPETVADDLIIFGQTVPPKGNVINYPAKKYLLLVLFEQLL